MSTKIYEAYRTMPGVNVWRLLADSRKNAQAPICARLHTLYSCVAADDVETTSDPYIKALARASNDDQCARLIVAQAIIRRAYKEQASSDLRNPYNLDVSLAIREHRGQHYMIPNADGPMRGALDFLANDKRIERYAYWNNSDRPRTVSGIEWYARKRNWSALMRKWQDVVVLNLVTPDSFYLVDIGDALISARRTAAKLAG